MTRVTLKTSEHFPKEDAIRRLDLTQKKKKEKKALGLSEWIITAKNLPGPLLEPIGGEDQTIFLKSLTDFKGWKESSRRCVRVSVFTAGKFKPQRCSRGGASFIPVDRCFEEGKMQPNTAFAAAAADAWAL